MERLQKIIASLGYTSRRNAEKLILDGKVSVNGKIVRELGSKAEISDEIIVEGVKLNNNINYEYYLLNKPRGVISSVSDDKGRKTVVDLIETNSRIYPIGRLDYDTTGLLLLTNDGEFANKLMHPSNNIIKTYLAKIEGILTKDDIAKLKNGVIVDGKKTKVVDFKTRKKDTEKNTQFISISVIEGRNHIVKNIFKELGHDVIKLTRTSYGFLDLGNLSSGEYRRLSVKEVKKFFSK